MTTVLFCPVLFNLAETTRMIQVARALDESLTPVFMGYENDYVQLVTGAGFDYPRGNQRGPKRSVTRQWRSTRADR